MPADTGGAGNPGGAGGGAAGANAGTAGVSDQGAAGTGSMGAAGDGAAGAGSSGGAGGSNATAGTAGTGKAGSSGNGGSSPDAGVPQPIGTPLGATCHLDVTVTTHNGGGNHAPKNVDAIWIDDSSGKFVKSLYVMARNEIQHLNAWNAATSAAGLSRNRVDAVTGASLGGYGTLKASWNCTDVNQKLVSLGGYRVCFDMNDGNGSDKSTCDSLTLGKTATTVMPPDALPSFTGRTLTYTP